MKKPPYLSKSLFIGFLFFCQYSLVVLAAGTSGGLTLTESGGARPMALGEAFAAAQDDISGLAYNPASLDTLESGQASFFYRTGMADDSFGQLSIGSPIYIGSLGLSIGYFNGGKIDLFDGASQRTVTVQKDLAVALGYAFKVGIVDLGVTGKYLSSELAEVKKAAAYAADAGFQIPLTHRLRFGSAVQNIGTQLKYNEEGDNLPRIWRSGLSWLVVPGQSSTRLMLDGVYSLNESKTYPALGLEQTFGPLAFRAGYKGADGLNHFSLGLGITLSRFTFDYSFGIVNQLDSMHMASLSTKFGSTDANKGTKQ